MKKIIVVLLLTAFSGIVASAPIKFNFVFSEDGGTARTTGYITYENTLLLNPGDNSFGIPDAAILDLYAEVTGSTAGDGVFTLNNFDFERVAFNTGGLALDFTRELVGQPTDGDPWGTVIQNKTAYDLQGEGKGRGSDFNLFGSAQKPPAKNSNNNKGINQPPNGVAPFLLRASSGEAMALISFSAHIPVVPTLSNFSLILTALLLMLLGFFYHKKIRSHQ